MYIIPKINNKLLLLKKWKVYLYDDLKIGSRLICLTNKTEDRVPIGQSII